MDEVLELAPGLTNTEEFVRSDCWAAGQHLRGGQHYLLFETICKCILHFCSFCVVKQGPLTIAEMENAATTLSRNVFCELMKFG